MVHAYINGFTFNTGTIEDMQAWWNDLKSDYNFSGMTLKVWKSKSSICGVYDPKPTNTFLIT